MNTVSYVVEYEYAAMGLIAVLVLIFCARRKYPRECQTVSTPECLSARSFRRLPTCLR